MVFMLGFQASVTVQALDAAGYPAAEYDSPEVFITSNFSSLTIDSMAFGKASQENGCNRQSLDRLRVRGVVVAQ
jgi:hypothetical protein